MKEFKRKGMLFATGAGGGQQRPPDEEAQQRAPAQDPATEEADAEKK